MSAVRPMATRMPLIAMTAVQALCKTAITKLDQLSQRVFATDGSTSGVACRLDCSGDSAKGTPLRRELFLQNQCEGKFAGISMQKQVGLGDEEVLRGKMR